jgi:hypothetical protein
MSHKGWASAVQDAMQKSAGYQLNGIAASWQEEEKAKPQEM